MVFMREPELLRVPAEDVVKRTVALKGALPFLDARALHLAPGLLMVPPLELAAAAERLLQERRGINGEGDGDGDGDGRDGDDRDGDRDGDGLGTRYTRAKLRRQPDRILAEIGYWDEEEEEAGTNPSSSDSTSTSSAAATAAASSKRMYTRISPDATDVGAVRERIEERQRGSKKRL
jgi:hypothetical protein